MNHQAEAFLELYGFSRAQVEAPDGRQETRFSIVREHVGLTDLHDNELEDPRHITDSLTFKVNGDGTFVQINSDGTVASPRFETDDAGDVVAFVQSVIASSIFELSGSPLDEGFEFEGTHYHAPFMFGDYADFEVEKRGDEFWIKHPAGPYRDAYLAWGNDFAQRILAGQAKAPEAFAEESCIAFPGI